MGGRWGEDGGVGHGLSVVYGKRSPILYCVVMSLNRGGSSLSRRRLSGPRRTQKHPQIKGITTAVVRTTPDLLFSSNQVSDSVRTVRCPHPVGWYTNRPRARLVLCIQFRIREYPVQRLLSLRPTVSPPLSRKTAVLRTSWTDTRGDVTLAFFR